MDQPISLRDDLTVGRNPVIELLRSDRPVDKIMVLNSQRSTGSLLKIIAMAKEKGIPVKDVTGEYLDQLSAGLNHQGVAAITASYQYAELEDIFALASSKNEPLFIVIADEIEDPHNLGAIIRTAEAAGAHGLVIPKRRSAGLTAAVMRASAGAAQHLPVTRVSNLASLLEQLKAQNVWIYVADLQGENWCQVDYRGGVALIIGSEGKGVSHLLKQKSDVKVRLPMLGKVDSLNASVAAGIVMYEIARQRLSIGIQ